MSFNFIKKQKSNRNIQKTQNPSVKSNNKVSLSERWGKAEIPLSDIYKILAAALSLCLLVMLILLACGVRYKTAKTADGIKINFFGIVRDDSPYSGVLHFSDSTKAKISGKKDTVSYSNGTIYKGTLKDLLPHGEGILENSLGIYYGNFDSGLLSGIGECDYADGSYYKGDFIGGVPHGNGKMLYADGSNYEGQFDNGEIQGVGLFIYTNGDYYQGEFYAGMRHGNGFYHWASGDSFNGEFSYSKITENGTYTYR